jgi:predicted ribonuclease YlaK
MKQYIIDTNIFMGLENFEKFMESFADGRLVVPFDVLYELDNNKWKEGDKGFKARRGIRHIEKFKKHLVFMSIDCDESAVDDRLIYLAAETGGEIITNDIGMTLKAEALEIEVHHYQEHLPIDKGWKICRDVTTAEFAGQYLAVTDEWESPIHELWRATNKGYRKVPDHMLKSTLFSKIRPLDIYQAFAIDSLKEDTITVITGHAGTGKTYLSLAYCMQELERGARRKVTIFVNPTKARGAEELGFYSGDRIEKLLQNSIGAILSSKFGDRMIVDKMIREGIIEILPISDIRGFEVSQSDIMYITEAQNLTTDLMKLCVQRCAEGSKVILEGDPETQLDNWAFEGKNNGLKRIIEVFSGFEGFGHVNLPNVRRSRIAEKAEEL